MKGNSRGRCDGAFWRFRGKYALDNPMPQLGYSAICAISSAESERMSTQAVVRKVDLPRDSAQLLSRIETRQAVVGVIGMGYVGQPLAIATHASGFQVIGFDIDPAKI